VCLDLGNNWHDLVECGVVTVEGIFAAKYHPVPEAA